MSAPTAAEIAWLNQTLPWVLEQQSPCGVRLGYGMKMELLDCRIRLLLQAGVELSGRKVLEPGACEGHITVGLCKSGANVTAFDVRLENVVKTFARCAAWGYSPRVFQMDASEIGTLGRFDIVFHSGLLYHLPSPADHLSAVARLADVIALDTHTARPGETLSMNEGFDGHWYVEDTGHCLSGVSSRSFWLTKKSLTRLFGDIGLDYLQLHDNDDAVNGPRSFWLLKREAFVNDHDTATSATDAVYSTATGNQWKRKGL